MASSANSRKARARRSRRQTETPSTDLQSLQALQQWLLPSGGIFSKIKFHGNSKWQPVELVWLAFCWAYSDARFVTDGITHAVKLCRKIFGAAPLSTYQGFMGALVKWTPTFMPVLWNLVRERMQQIGGELFHVKGWLPIAFDGSRSSAPRTKSNETALCATNYGQGKTAKYRKKKTKGMRRRKNEKNKPNPKSHKPGSP